MPSRRTLEGGLQEEHPRGGPLHPDRVARALLYFSSDLRVDKQEYERITQTAVAALQLMGKMQRVLGVTPQVADVGSALVQLLEVIK